MVSADTLTAENTAVLVITKFLSELLLDSVIAESSPAKNFLASSLLELLTSLLRDHGHICCTNSL
jgi:hypothetical protein